VRRNEPCRTGSVALPAWLTVAGTPGIPVANGEWPAGRYPWQGATRQVRASAGLPTFSWRRAERTSMRTASHVGTLPGASRRPDDPRLHPQASLPRIPEPHHCPRTITTRPCRPRFSPAGSRALCGTLALADPCGFSVDRWPCSPGRQAVFSPDWARPRRARWMCQDRDDKEIGTERAIVALAQPWAAHYCASIWVNRCGGARPASSQGR
jgi:hypothetical protein